MAITEVRIHPAIGIARVGNSDSDFFIGPEKRWDRSAPAGGYKDAQCRVKRQAARFRIFGYDNGVPVELTAADATIEWTVHLVNRKAVGPGFPNGGTRNAGYSGADRDALVIDPGARTLDGPDQHKEFDTGTFKVKNHPAVKVMLGQMRTDDAGRLLVLGGLGTAGSPSNHGFSGFADNDEWHDDVADGPVTAKVVYNGQTFTAAGAWVITAPPKFAPPLEYVLRFWDMLYDLFVPSQLQVPATPSYVNDIYPILQGAIDIGAVNGDAVGHHAFSHPMAGAQWVVDRLTATGGSHMPKLESEANNSLKDLKLTATQIAIMQKWANGTVNSDWIGAWGQRPPPDVAITPDGLDKAALENCVGGALFPGIEAGQFLRDKNKFLPVVMINGVPSFRIDHAKVSAGEVTQSMAVPWQSDFLACESYWWPVHRPNQVKVLGYATPQEWTRPGFSTADFATGKWNKLGFVTRQGNDLVETDRCDTADTWVNLVTPALTFADIPQGPMGTQRKAARAIVFEIKSTAAVTLNFTAPANASLTRYTASPYMQSPTGGSVATARLWIVYAPPNDSHNVTDSITVTCPETSQTWTIPITANSVPRKVAAAAMVLDKSYSMTEDRGDGLGNKSQSVRDAANTFVDVMLPGDSLSLTAFDDSASVLKGLTVLGDPNDPFDMSRSGMHNTINGTGLDPGGDTSIGDGIFEGRGTLSGASAQVQSLVVLTDGNENSERWISQVADQINETTYAVGVGTAANTSAVALETISGNNGGYLLITGAALGGDNEFLLKKYFLQILAGVSNAEIILDPVGMISAGQIQRVPFVVCEQDNLADIILMAQDRKYLQFVLETPYGQIVDPTLARSIGGQFIVTANVSYYRIPLPLLVDPGRPSHAGTWNAVLGYGYGGYGAADLRHFAANNAANNAAGASLGRQRYSIIAHTWSDVAFTASAHQSGFTPGATVNLVAGLSAAGIPFTANSYVRADVTRPGGTTFTVNLRSQGEQFSGSFAASVPGDYQIRMRANGLTDRGNAFTRERALSAGVWRGGDTPPRGGPNDIGTIVDGERARWCAFLKCVLATLSRNDPLMKRLHELGLDPRDFQKCVELLCPDTPKPQATAVPVADELRRLVDQLQQALRSHQ